jgi:hypothetical protein
MGTYTVYKPLHISAAKQQVKDIPSRQAFSASQLVKRYHMCLPKALGILPADPSPPRSLASTSDMRCWSLS